MPPVWSQVMVNKMQQLFFLSLFFFFLITMVSTLACTHLANSTGYSPPPTKVLDNSIHQGLDIWKKTPNVCWNFNLRPHGSQPTSSTTRSYPWVKRCKTLSPYDLKSNALGFGIHYWVRVPHLPLVIGVLFFALSFFIIPGTRMTKILYIAATYG